MERRPPQPLTGPAGQPVPHDVARILHGSFAAGRVATIPAREKKRLETRVGAAGPLPTR